jgi:hypothetical protein
VFGCPLPPWRTESPPPDLQRAVDLIAKDLEPGGTGGVAVAVEPGRVDDETWTLYVDSESGGGGGSGFEPDKPFPELVAELAELVQDRMIDVVWGAWPPCPVHGHPLMPQADDATAWWVCPSDESWKAAVGTLADDYEYVAAVRSRA